MLRLLGWVLVAWLLALLHAWPAVASIRALGGWGAERASAVGCGCMPVEHCDERAVGPPGSRGASKVVFAPNKPDSENRLVSLNASEAGYLYDGDGQLVRRAVGGVATTYLVDDQTPARYTQIAEERVGGVVAKSYVFGPQRVSMRNADGVRWYTYDAHSGVRGLLDAAGVVTDTYDYDAFGTVIARTGTTENAFTYRGEQLDATLGLQYLRARWMNPAKGRFGTRDGFDGIVADPPSLAAYHFAVDSPLDFDDPTGCYVSNTDLVATVMVVGILATLADNALLALFDKLAHPDRGGTGPPSKEVLVDTGAVYQWHPPVDRLGWAGADSLLGPGETPVVSTIVVAEVWLNYLKTVSEEFRGMHPPAWFGEFRPVADEGTSLEREGVKLWLLRHSFKEDTTGLEGDATLLTTAMVSRRPLITTDRRLALGAQSISVDSRYFKLGQPSPGEGR